MIAWNTTDYGTWAFTHKNFSEVLKLAEEQFSWKEYLDLEFGVFKDMTFSIGDGNYYKLEKKLDIILKNFFYDEVFVNKYRYLVPSYHLKNELSQKYIYDFLEAYRVSFKLIDFTQRKILFPDQDIITLLRYSKQTLTEKLLNRYGKFIHEINFPLNSLNLISGTSLKFWLCFGNDVLKFDIDGISESSKEAIPSHNKGIV